MLKQIQDVSQEDAEKEFNVIKQTIDDIFYQRASTVDLKKLFEIVWNLVSHKYGGFVYEETEKVINNHLKEIGQKLSSSNENFLKLALQEWQKLSRNEKMVSEILMKVDTDYAEKQKKLPSLKKVTLTAFRTQILQNYSKKIQLLMMDVIQKERDGEGVTDRSLVVGLTQMLIELDKGVDDKEKKAYTSIFEDEFLTQSRSYFRKEASNYFEIATATQYLERVRNRLKEEQERTSACADVGTPAKIQRVILEEFVERYKEALVKKNGSGVLIMLLNNNIEELKLVYEVLSLVEGALGPTIDMLKEQALKEGKAIVKDPENDKVPQNLVVQLKDLRSKYEKLLNEAFSKQAKGNKRVQDPSFVKVVKEAFDETVNENERFAEYLSLYIDKKIRKGKEQVEENDADKLFSELLLVLKHLSDKDLFLEYYKNHLAKRLLTEAETPDDDNEKTLLTKLKQDYGFAFTNKLEGMIKDLKTSEILKDDWKRYITEYSKKKGTESPPFDLLVQVLTYGYWPAVKTSTLVLPSYCQLASRNYDSFYGEKFDGRRLMWMYSMGTGDLKANGYSKKFEFTVSTFQVGILLSFNDSKSISFSEFIDLLKIPADSLKSSLAQLTAPTDKEDVSNSKILLHDAKKDKNGKLSFNGETKFTPNESFSNKSIKVKIGTSATKSTTQQNAETLKKVNDDRKLATQAAIVRVMKMRKTLSHKDLVNELRQQLNSYFQPSLRMVTEAIGFLIDSDYLARDEDDSSRYIYVP
eukprot:gene4361-7717_t